MKAIINPTHEKKKWTNDQQKKILLEYENQPPPSNPRPQPNPPKFRNKMVRSTILAVFSYLFFPKAWLALGCGVYRFDTVFTFSNPTEWGNRLVVTSKWWTWSGREIGIGQWRRQARQVWPWLAQNAAEGRQPPPSISLARNNMKKSNGGREKTGEKKRRKNIPTKPLALQVGGGEGSCGRCRKNNNNIVTKIRPFDNVWQKNPDLRDRELPNTVPFGFRFSWGGVFL